MWRTDRQPASQPPFHSKDRASKRRTGNKIIVLSLSTCPVVRPTDLRVICSSVYLTGSEMYWCQPETVKYDTLVCYLLHCHRYNLLAITTINGEVLKFYTIPQVNRPCLQQDAWQYHCPNRTHPLLACFLHKRTPPVGQPSQVKQQCQSELLLNNDNQNTYFNAWPLTPVLWPNALPRCQWFTRIQV